MISTKTSPTWNTLINAETQAQDKRNARQAASWYSETFEDAVKPVKHWNTIPGIGSLYGGYFLTNADGIKVAHIFGGWYRSMTDESGAHRIEDN